MNYTENVKTKSLGLAIVLSLIFGPIGLFYASVSGGLIMSLTPLAVFLLLFLGVISQSSVLLASSAILLVIFALSYWIICVIWAATSVSNYNNKVINDARHEEFLRILDEKNQINNSQIVQNTTPEETTKVPDKQNIDQPTIKVWKQQNPNSSTNEYYEIYGTPQSTIITPTYTYEEAYYIHEKPSNSWLYITLGIIAILSVILFVYIANKEGKIRLLPEKYISKEDEALIRKRNMVKWLSKTWIYEKVCFEEKIKKVNEMSGSNNSMDKIVYNIAKKTMKALETSTFEYVSTGAYTISNSKESLAILLTKSGSWEFNDDFTKILLTIDDEKQKYDIKELSENSLKLSYIAEGEEIIESFIPYMTNKNIPISDNLDRSIENNIESNNDGQSSTNSSKSTGTEWKVLKNESEFLYVCFENDKNPDLKISVCFDKNIRATICDNMQAKFVKYKGQHETIPLFFQKRQISSNEGGHPASYWIDTYAEKYRGKITGIFTFTNTGRTYDLDVNFKRKKDGKEFYFQVIEDVQDENNSIYKTNTCF